MATAATETAHAPPARRQPRRVRVPGSVTLVAAALALMVPVYLVPMLQLVTESLGAPSWSLANYARTFDDPAFWPVIARTFVMSGQVTILCAVIGYPVAYAMLRVPARWRNVILLAIVLPLWTSTLVRSFAWVVILGQDGLANQALRAAGLTTEPVQLIYTRFAILVGFVQVMLPYFVFPLYGVMSRLDLRLVNAARSLGASPRRAFFAVFFPLTLPGLASGAILIFILTLGFFVTPTLLGGLHEITYVMLIERQMNTLMDWNLAAAMSIVFLAFTAIIIVLAGRFLGFSAGHTAGSGSSANIAWLGRLSVWLATRFVRIRPGVPPGGQVHAAADGRIGLPLTIYVIAVMAFIVLPITLFFPISFSDAPYLSFPPPALSLRWYDNYFSRPDWLEPTWMSLRVALITMVLATLVGGLAAVGLSRAGRGGNAILAFLVSPMVVPHLIIAVGIYLMLARVRLVGTATGLVLGHLVLAVPVVIVVLLNALRNVDLLPEKAARSLGAGPIRAFWSTTLVMIRPSIVSAAFFAFLVSFEDLIMALFLSGVGATTLPKRMWDSIVLEIDPTVAAVSTMLIVLSIVLFTIAQLAHRGLNRGSAGQRQT